ncbi:MAG TPA: RNA polymerase sigma factor [Chitinophagaceae bacterium]
MNEWTLIERLQQGDQSAFKTIVETWQDMVYNTALGIVQQSEDAEDIAQEVFAQVYQSIRFFKGESKLSTWLYRITISKAMDHLRRAKRKKRFAFVRSLFGDEHEADLHPPDFHHPGVVLDNKENAAVLFKAIAKLPDNQRIAFTLHKIEGLSHQDIGSILNTTVSSVESLLHRAKANLRKELSGFYREPE